MRRQVAKVRGRVELPVATPGVRARRSWSRFEALWGSQPRSITSAVSGGHLPLAYRPSTSFAQVEGGRVGCRVHPSGCALALGRLAGCRTSSSCRDVERVQSEPVATPVRFPGESFVPAGFLAESDTRRWSNSVREAKGIERATAVVHPIKVSQRTQDRVDRKRSRREYPTNTGARFAGRALCSPSQREERRPLRRRRR